MYGLNEAFIGILWLSSAVSIFAHSSLIAGTMLASSSYRPVDEGTVSVEIVAPMDGSHVPPQGEQVRVQETAQATPIEAVQETEPQVAIPDLTEANDVESDNTAAEESPEEITAPNANAQVEEPDQIGEPQLPHGVPNGIKNADQLKQYPGNVPPEYPLRERIERKEGKVSFLAYVNDLGTIQEVRLKQSSGRSSFDQVAWEAFKKYRFYPGQSGWVEKSFVFSLKGSTKTYGGQLRF